jgi:hypothetical protein
VQYFEVQINNVLMLIIILCCILLCYACLEHCGAPITIVMSVCLSVYLLLKLLNNIPGICGEFYEKLSGHLN